MNSGQLISRDLGPVLLREARRSPTVTVTGPRQSGKTTLCRQTFPDKPWVSLEPADVREYATTDPRGFIAQHRDGAIFDEIQRAPDLLTYLQGEIDERPEPGRFILTGSENLVLSERVSQSLAGRTTILHLLPPSFDELQRFESPPRDLWSTLWMGAYPRLHHQPEGAKKPKPRTWLDSYIASYLERDVRQVLRVTRLEAFRRFLVLAAGRSAQEIHLSRLGDDAGVTHSTAREWLSVLETSFVCFQLPAWHRNIRKQQIRAGKLHFFDTGLLCALLGIHSPEQLQVHPLRGAIFETWVVSEVLKARLHKGLGRQMFHFRESRGLEVDLVVAAEKQIIIAEAKSGATISGEFFRPLRQLNEAITKQGEQQTPENILVYGGLELQHRSDVSALPWNRIHSISWGTDHEEADEDDDDGPRPSDVELAHAVQAIAQAVAPHFALGGRFHGRYEAPVGDDIEPMMPRPSVWRMPIFPVATASARMLRVYALEDGPRDLISAHWRNEARTLHRLATSAHPTLPKLYEAGRLQGGEAETTYGYLVLEDTGEPLVPGHPLLGEWAKRPDKAFQAFFSLIDALALLHEEGILHRTLTPSATRAAWSPDGTLMLDDFQLSAFASTWLDRAALSETTKLLPGQSSREGACLAPERLEILFQIHQTRESFTSDVFALGMIGLGWLVAPFESWATEAIFKGDQYDEQAHRTLLRWLEERADSSGLPPALRYLLMTMVAFDRSDRPPSACEVYDELRKIYGNVLSYLELGLHANAPPSHLYYLNESIERLYGEGRARTAPSQPDHQEYAALILSDLEGGILTWSPRGFLPWSRERDPERTDKMRAAQIVLIGEHYAYFCQYLYHGRPKLEQRVLVIKFMLSAHLVRELRRQERARPLPPLEARFFDPKTSRPRPIADNAPSWAPVVISAQFEEQHPSAAPLIAASRWLLSAQRAKLALQEYAVQRVDDDKHGYYLCQTDDDAPFSDDSEDSAFARLRLAGKQRPPMGTLFEGLYTRGLEEGDERLFALRTSRKHRNEDRYHFSQRIHDDAIALRESGDLPARGFLRPDDTGERYLLGRQFVALDRVEKRHPYLAAQLAAPTAVELLPDGPCDLTHLDSETAALVKRILSSWPVFILQGPPGTGKTFVARQLIRAVLEIDPFARILVAAQSHHALDNLLEGVVGEVVSKDHIILRGASPRTEHKIGEKAKGHTLRGALQGVMARANSPSDAPNTLSKRWQKSPLKETDLAQRLQRSASVVFSTCTAATSRALGLEGGRGFDWVIVEEAARAWITELLMPMMHGTRWLLIGDHRQLHAFQEQQHRALLARDASDQITAEATGVEVDRDWDRFLNHFEHLMRAPKVSLGFEPRHTLSVQRRMHPDIGDMVSRTFYDGKLQAHGDAHRVHGLGTPPFVRDTALAWIDTSCYRNAAYEQRVLRGGYENPCEAQLVASFMDQISASLRTHDAEIPPLALLTPYRAQVDLLSRTVSENHREIVHTIDAFQGREAEVVVVSLVRNNSGREGKPSVGFLAEPERVNVLLSRARRLLIIVGNLEHFTRSEDPHWQSITQYVHAETKFIVDPQDSLDFEWPKRKRRRKGSRT